MYTANNFLKHVLHKVDGVFTVVSIFFFQKFEKTAATERTYAALCFQILLFSTLRSIYFGNFENCLLQVLIENSCFEFSQLKRLQGSQALKYFKRGTFILVKT